MMRQIDLPVKLFYHFLSLLVNPFNFVYGPYSSVTYGPG